MEQMNRNGAEETAQKKKWNVVFLGGSITAGSGASSQSKSWVSIVTNYFIKRYPDRDVTGYNAGMGGTGSNMGLFRLKRDVISKNPDLLFIDFTLNDSDMRIEESLRFMEGIVRKLLSQDKKPQIVFIYSTKEPAEKVNAMVLAHERLANHYHIPSINFRAAADKYVANGGSFPDLTLPDLVHPNDAGYALYADDILFHISQNGFIKEIAFPANGYCDYYDIETEILPAGQALRTGAWVHTGGSIYESATAGDFMTYSFYGKVFAIQALQMSNGGKFSVSIDGGDPEIVDTYYDIKDHHTLKYANVCLESTFHTAVITVLGEKNDLSTGTRVALKYLIVEDDYKQQEREK